MEIDKLQDSLDRYNKKEINLEEFINEVYDGLRQVMIHRSVSGSEDILQQFMIHLLEREEILKFNTAREFMSYAHKFSDNTAFYQRVKDTSMIFTDNEELLDILEESNVTSSNLADSTEDVVLGDKDEVSYSLIDFLHISNDGLRIVKPTKERIALTGLTISEFSELTKISRQRIYMAIKNNSLPLDISEQLDKYYKLYNPTVAEYTIRELIIDKFGSFKGDSGKSSGINLLTIYKAFSRGLSYSVFISFKNKLNKLENASTLSKQEKKKLLKPYEYLLDKD